MLALLCATTGDDTPGRSANQANQATIYDRILRRFLAHENRWPVPESEPTDIDRLIGVLGPLAFHFASQPDGWVDRMAGSQIISVLRAMGPAFTELNRDAASVLRDLSVRAGILVPSGSQSAGQNPPYLFLHRSVAEYLVAVHLATLPRADWMAVVDEHLWFDYEWQDAITLLGATLVRQERPGDAVLLVRRLLEQPDDAFNVGLFRAMRVVCELPDPGVVPADIVAGATRRMLALLEGEGDREFTENWLGTWLPRLPRQVTEALMARLDDDCTAAAAKVLVHSRDPSVMSTLIECLDHPGRLPDRVFAANGEPAVATFLGLLVDPDRATAAHRVRALAGR